ncbi:uncharacterized protein E5676_scaffold64062G00010 [Cucumis melo var. makuwa]|uniref:Uncharacterized protein n=1 Tax=Cucumis melo var. makuwa TaxID=1194695 RepID=A0A5A7UR96_CUCMM|nr:uncharacterized protein E6C27_scaffold9731G00050 [Cucumis melo var. makuwa]TYK10328.1 uncharacterized protein E5676_scaffold64062G00010 [Cucumis melo var. makuwa]
MKRKINHFEIVALMQAKSDIFKNGVPKKMTNPESFTVSYSIGGMDLGRALCNLATSINLMPLSTFKKLGIWEITKLIRRFLPFWGGHSCQLVMPIDVHQGELTMRFNDEEIKFNVINPMKFPADIENYNTIESHGWDYCEEEPYYELFGTE